MAFLRNEGFFVFLYGKVVVILQWISRETKGSVFFEMVGSYLCNLATCRDWRGD